MYVSSWHMFDAVIVLVSLALELSLRGVAQEVASLLILFRRDPRQEGGRVAGRCITTP